MQSERIRKILLNALLTAVVVAVMGVVGIFGGSLLFLVVGSLPTIYTLAGLYILLTVFLCMKIWLGKLPRLSKWLLAGAACLVVVSGVAYGGYLKYINSIPSVGDSQGVNLMKYAPYADSSAVALLDEPPTLKLEAELPRLDCATALYPVMSAFVRAVYPQGEYPLYVHDDESPVYYSNTVGAYEALIDGQRDIIFAAAPSEKQLAMARETGVELELTPIGREAFVFFVHRANPVDALSVEQIRSIYSGELTNWKQLGGKNNYIRAFQRPENSGSQTMLVRIMEDAPLMEPIEENVVGSMGGIINRTASYRNHKNAIGYSFRFFCTDMMEVDLIKLLAVDGVYPDRQSIADGSYPMTSDFRRNP